MSENTHANKAKALLMDCYQEDAKVEATLALAYEQRTANLIAYLKYSEGDDYEAVHSAIKERLGLA